MITFDDFAKLEIRIGKVITAQKVENADKLLRLMFDFGDESRQIVSGIAEWYQPEELVGKLIPVITNLEPRKFRGVESQGMILAADEDGKPVILQPAQDVPPGSRVR